MKRVYILLLGLVLLSTACNSDLDQVPPNIPNSKSLKDFQGVLNAAYYYQLGGVTPMAVMGDFRADNAKMFESPYTSFDAYDLNLTAMNDQFFRPFYTAMYKSILSANIVIENSQNATHIAEAKFLRALSYFKLVRVFGDVPVNLKATPDPTDFAAFKRQPAADVYNNVIIPDLMAARDALSATKSSTGRATKLAAQGMLGKVYMQMGNFTAAEPQLAAVVSGAAGAGFSLRPTYVGVFGSTNDLNSEILFATQISSSITDEYTYSTDWWSWYLGQDTKSPSPVDPRLVAAYSATDVRKAANTQTVGANIVSPKYNQANGPNHDWIELRLADVILLYAEALNETTNATGANSASILTRLDAIRTRAGLTSLSGTATTQAAVRTAILKERRLEMAFEGQRWFDLVRTGTVNAEMGATIDSKYYLFPIPISEILATNGVITQNAGYN